MIKLLKIYPFFVELGSRSKEWNEFSVADEINQAIIEQILFYSTLPIDLKAKEFNAIIRGFKSGTKELHDVKKFKILLGESGLEVAELNNRLKELMELLDHMNDNKMPAIELELKFSQPGDEAPYIPFLKHITAPQHHIEDLIIDVAYSKSNLKFIRLGLDDNTSIKKLHLKSDAHLWTCLDGLNCPIESIKLYQPINDASTSKKGIKSLISLLHRNQNTITTIELKYDFIEYEKDVLAAISNIRTLKRFLWINHKKCSGGEIASVLENNTDLEELILESNCEVNNVSSMLQPLTTLCQRNLRLNLGEAGELIPALENNKSVTKLKLSEHALLEAKNCTTICTMKKLKVLTLVKHSRFTDYQRTITTTQDTTTISQADLVPIVGPNSPIRHLKIINYRLQQQRIFWDVLANNTSLSLLESKVRTSSISEDTNFLVAMRNNPFLDIYWPDRTTTMGFNYMIYAQKSKTPLQSLRNGVKFLQTILLSKHRGLFDNIPNEVIFYILRHYIGRDLPTSQLETLFEIASDRASLFDNPNTRAKLREIWDTIKK